MVPTATTVSIGLLLALSACSAPQSGSTSGAATSPTGATTGTLTGLVRMYGGPMNPQTGKQALNGSPGRDWPVTVLSGGQTVAETTSDADGTFRLTLAPGRYTLACGQEPGVTVVAGHTVSVDCDVPVP
jgi:hypothetical protein